MDIGQPPKLNRHARRALRRRQAAEPSRRFEFETFEPRVLMSADLLPVHGAINVPGQTNQYSFNLTDAKQIYFDSQTPNSQSIDWTLQGPSGTVVANRSFEQSDAGQVSGPAALSLPAGDYTLTVSGAGNATGAYDFQLLDLANAAPITVGNTVTGNLAPADATNLYQFNAQAGDQLFFDSHTLGSQSTVWRVIGPEGTVVFDRTPLGQDPPIETLTRTGTYTLMVEGNVDQTGSAAYNFTVFPVATTQAPLTLGATQSGTLATPGHTDEYDISIAQPTSVLFDSLSDRSDIQWKLTGASGDLVTQRPFNASDAGNLVGSDAVTLAAGTYRLSVTGVGSATGDYGFRLLDLASATPAALNVAQSGTLGGTGTGTDLVSFQLVAGQTYYLSSISASGNVTERLFNPAGTQVFTQSFGDRAAIVPEVSGTYTLAIEGGIGNLQPVDYQVALVESTVRQVAIGATDTVTDSIDLASQSVAYSFSLGAETKLLFDTLSADPGLQWSLTGATGATVTNRSLQNADGLNSTAAPLLDLLPGDYTLTVSGIGAITGSYSFRLLDTAAATPFTLGDDVTATLDSPGANTLYSFDATAGDTISLNVENGDYNTAWRLLDPYGNTVFGPTHLTSQTGITLGATGTYTLSIEGALNAGGADTVEFASSLDSHTDPAALTGMPLVIGTVVNGNFAAPDGADDYVFTAAAGARLYFDSLSTDNADVAWSLVGPAGVVVPVTAF